MGLAGDPSTIIETELRSLAGWEIALITERLLVRARQEQHWGTPPVLWGLLAVVKAQVEQAPRVVSLLESIPRSLLQPDVVPALSGREWTRSTLEKWYMDSETSQYVKNAIKVMKKDGI